MRNGSLVSSFKNSMETILVVFSPKIILTLQNSFMYPTNNVQIVQDLSYSQGYKIFCLQQQDCISTVKRIIAIA